MLAVETEKAVTFSVKNKKAHGLDSITLSEIIKASLPILGISLAKIIQFNPFCRWVSIPNHGVMASLFRFLNLRGRMEPSNYRGILIRNCK